MNENKAQTEQPKGMTLTRNKNQLIITRTWFSLVTVVILAGITGYFDVMIYQKNFIPLFMAELENEFPLEMLIPAIAMAGLHYALLVSLLNKTDIRLNPEYLSIRHYPVPYPGNKSIRSDEIAQIYCQRDNPSYNHDTGSRSKAKFHINAKLHNDAVINLLTTSTSGEQLMFIEQELENFLGIEDKPVDDVETQLIRDRDKYEKELEEKKWVYSGSDKTIENKRLGVSFTIPDNLEAQVCMDEEPFKSGFFQPEKDWHPLTQADNWNLFQAKASGVLGLSLTVGRKPLHGISYEEVMNSKAAKMFMDPVSSKAEVELGGLKGFSVTRKLKSNPLYIRQVWLFKDNKLYHLQMDIPEGDKAAHEVATKFESGFNVSGH